MRTALRPNFSLLLRDSLFWVFQYFIGENGYNRPINERVGGINSIQEIFS
jgi:hypothetical protein